MGFRSGMGESRGWMQTEPTWREHELGGVDRFGKRMTNIKRVTDCVDAKLSLGMATVAQQPVVSDHQTDIDQCHQDETDREARALFSDRTEADALVEAVGSLQADQD